MAVVVVVGGGRPVVMVVDRCPLPPQNAPLSSLSTHRPPLPPRHRQADPTKRPHATPPCGGAHGGAWLRQFGGNGVGADAGARAQGGYEHHAVHQGVCVVHSCGECVWGGGWVWGGEKEKAPALCGRRAPFRRHSFNRVRPPTEKPRALGRGQHLLTDTHSTQTHYMVTLRVALAGPGLVGSESLTQLAAATPSLAARGLNLVLVGVCNSSKAAVGNGLDPTAWRGDLAPHASPLAAVCETLKTGPRPAIFVDCTAGESGQDCYAELLAAGVSIDTANKCGGAGDAARAAAIRAAAASPTGGSYRGEATVGAGLPILSTLADLLSTGDRVASISGVWSGTLSTIFGDVSRVGAPSHPLSSAVAAARAAGFTEPDPRDDLSGMDVARKAVILGRAAGLDGLTLADVAVEALIPPARRCWSSPRERHDRGTVSPDGFVNGLASSSLDSELAARAATAAADGGAVLRYVATVDVATATASVGVVAVPPASPLAAVTGGGNAFVFQTARYTPACPLVVSGPGAGAAVTAAGVLGDVLAEARAHGAKV